MLRIFHERISPYALYECISSFVNGALGDAPKAIQIKTRCVKVHILICADLWNIYIKNSINCFVRGSFADSVF